MIKKSIIILVVLSVLFITGLGGYLLISPEIVILNNSSQKLDEVIVKLPSNQIVFGAIKANSESKIYYSWSQTDGVYDYQVSFADGKTQSGQCGHVINFDVGKQLSLIIQADLEVECAESNKI